MTPFWKKEVHDLLSWRPVVEKIGNHLIAPEADLKQTPFAARNTANKRSEQKTFKLSITSPFWITSNVYFY